jgi:hypothetical protein
MSSPNVFAEAWSNWIHVGVAFPAAIGGLYLAVRLGARVRAQGWLVAILAIVGFGGGLTGGMLLPWPSYVGRYEHLYWMRTGDREILAVLTRYAAGGRGGHNEFHHILSFDLATGEPLGRARLPDREYSGPYLEIRGSRGTLAYLSSPEGYVVVDLTTATVVARQKERAKELGSYKTLGFDERRWAASVLLQDGQTMLVPMGSQPAGQAALARIEPDGTFCGTWSRNPRPGTRIAGLLRAVRVQSTASECRFQSSTDTVQLYLHRGTAFGDGSYLVSAVTDAGVRKWTVDLSARADASLSYEILLAEPSGASLRILVGGREAIYWLLLDPMSGQVSGERALY